MKLRDYFKKRVFFFVVSVVFIAIGLIITSYTLSLNKYDKKNNNSSLDIVYIDNQSSINVSEYPMSNDIGNIYAPENKVKIINKSKKKREYKVKLEVLKQNNFNDLQKISVSINGEVPFSLADVKENIIMSKEINGLEEDIIDVRIWGNKDLMLESDMGKTIALRLLIEE